MSKPRRRRPRTSAPSSSAPIRVATDPQPDPTATGPGLSKPPKLAAADAVEQLAAAGNLRAVQMLDDGLPGRLRGEADDDGQGCEPHVALAMLRAGNWWADHGPHPTPTGPYRCEACGCTDCRPAPPTPPGPPPAPRPPHWTVRNL